MLLLLIAQLTAMWPHTTSHLFMLKPNNIFLNDIVLQHTFEYISQETINRSLWESNMIAPMLANIVKFFRTWYRNKFSHLILLEAPTKHKNSSRRYYFRYHFETYLLILATKWYIFVHTCQKDRSKNSYLAIIDSAIDTVHVWPKIFPKSRPI